MLVSFYIVCRELSILIAFPGKGPYNKGNIIREDTL